MKSILLTSTAIVAFAGAASAEVTWGADAEFGYNEEVENGFYFDGGLALATTAGMMMGLEAGIGLDVDLNFSDNSADDGDFGGTFSDIDIDGSDFVVFVRNDVSGLYIGDTETATEQHWAGTTNMEQDGFLEVGDVDDGADDGDFVDGVMRADLTFGAVSTSVSYFFADNDIADVEDDDGDDLNGLRGLQLGISADLGQFTVGMAYQEEVSDALVNAEDLDNDEEGIIGETDLSSDGNGSIDELIGVYAGTTFAGASVKLAYASNETTDENSTGIEVGYTFGPVTATVFYSSESDDDIDDNYGLGLAYDGGPLQVTTYYHDGNDEEIGLEGNYDFGNGLVIYAGYVDSADDDEENREEYYVSGEYDLGGGAALIASYGEVGSEYDGDLDEVGNAYETNEGATIAISFSF